eukprot:gene9220-10181_t
MSQPCLLHSYVSSPSTGCDPVMLSWTARDRPMACRPPDHLPAQLIDHLLSLPRWIKTLTSSPLEAAILKLTMPSNQLYDPEDWQHLLHLLRSPSTSTSSRQNEIAIDRMHVVMKKIINKMRSSDWRVTVKGLGIIHRLLVSSGINKSFFASYLTYFQEIELVIESHIVSGGSDEKGSSDLIYWKYCLSYGSYLLHLCEICGRGGRSLGEEVIVHLCDLMHYQGPLSVIELVNNYFSVTRRLLTHTDETLLSAMKKPYKSSSMTAKGWFFRQFTTNISNDLVYYDLNMVMRQMNLLGSNRMPHPQLHDTEDDKVSTSNPTEKQCSMDLISPSRLHDCMTIDVIQQHAKEMQAHLDQIVKHLEMVHYDDAAESSSSSKMPFITSEEVHEFLSKEALLSTLRNSQMCLGVPSWILDLADMRTVRPFASHNSPPAASAATA